MSHRLQLQGIIVTSFRQPHFSFFSRYTSTTTSCGKNLEMEEVKGASDLLVGDPALLEKKIDAIRLGGPQKLQAHGLLVEGGLTYDSIRQSVANANIAFREGVCELFEFLEERDAPVLIFSAGLADIIEEVLRQKLHRSFKNVRIVSNRMVFDDDGRLAICEERPAKVGAIGFNGVFIWKNFALLPVCPSAIGKLIHSLNKNEHALDMAAPVHERLGDMDGTTTLRTHLAAIKKLLMLFL
ncbi:Cytosolic 5'-nucleotidase 3A [Glycine max]|nr:Cytosolic 5'-nucleotidase 3A [Glycine max]